MDDFHSKDGPIFSYAVKREEGDKPSFTRRQVLANNADFIRHIPAEKEHDLARRTRFVSPGYHPRLCITLPSLWFFFVSCCLVHAPFSAACFKKIFPTSIIRTSNQHLQVHLLLLLDLLRERLSDEEDEDLDLPLKKE